MESNFQSSFSVVISQLHKHICSYIRYHYWVWRLAVVAYLWTLKCWRRYSESRQVFSLFIRETSKIYTILTNSLLLFVVEKPKKNLYRFLLDGTKWIKTNSSNIEDEQRALSIYRSVIDEPLAIYCTYQLWMIILTGRYITPKLYVVVIFLQAILTKNP